MINDQLVNKFYVIWIILCHYIGSLIIFSSLVEVNFPHYFLTLSFFLLFLLFFLFKLFFIRLNLRSPHIFNNFFTFWTLFPICREPWAHKSFWKDVVEKVSEYVFRWKIVKAHHHQIIITDTGWFLDSRLIRSLLGDITQSRGTVVKAWTSIVRLIVGVFQDTWADGRRSIAGVLPEGDGWGTSTRFYFIISHSIYASPDISLYWH